MRNEHTQSALDLDLVGMPFTGEAQVKNLNLRKPTFAAGCFWGVEEFLGKFTAFCLTRVGFTAVKTPHPKYEDARTMALRATPRAVEIQFDPQKVSYVSLLNLFFKMHDPTTLNRAGK